MSNKLYKYTIYIDKNKSSIYLKEYDIKEGEIVEIDGELKYVTNLYPIFKKDAYSLTYTYFTKEKLDDKLYENTINSVKLDIYEHLNKEIKLLNEKIENNIKIAKELLILKILVE